MHCRIQCSQGPMSSWLTIYNLPPSTYHLKPTTYNLKLPPTTYHRRGGYGKLYYFLQLKFFFSPIVRVHHLLNSLAQCSECNSVLNGVGSNDFKASRHQHFEILGFQGFAIYPNFKVLDSQGLATIKILRSWVSRVLRYITILRSWVSRVPRQKRRARSKIHQGPRTLDSVNPGSRIFLGPWHKSGRYICTYP